MSKTLLSLVSGSCRLPLCSIDKTMKGDIYMAPLPASKSGLHMSFHQSGEMHIRKSPKFEFDEPINFNLPDYDEISSWLRKNTYDPDHGEDVLVLSGSYGNYQQQISNKNDLCINLNNITNDFCLHQVSIEILPKYFQTSPLETFVIIDETDNSVAIYNKRLGFSFNFSMEYGTIEKQLETMPLLKDLICPMKKAFQHESELINQGKIPSYEFFPKEFEFPKLKIKNFF